MNISQAVAFFPLLVIVTPNITNKNTAAFASVENELYLGLRCNRLLHTEKRGAKNLVATAHYCVCQPAAVLHTGSSHAKRTALSIVSLILITVFFNVYIMRGDRLVYI